MKHGKKTEEDGIETDPLKDVGEDFHNYLSSTYSKEKYLKTSV